MFALRIRPFSALPAPNPFLRAIVPQTLASVAADVARGDAFLQLARTERRNAPHYKITLSLFSLLLTLRPVSQSWVTRGSRQRENKNLSTNSSRGLFPSVDNRIPVLFHGPTAWVMPTRRTRQKLAIVFLPHLLIGLQVANTLGHTFHLNLKAQQWLQIYFPLGTSTSHFVITCRSDRTDKYDTYCYLSAGLKSPGPVWLADNVSTLSHVRAILTGV